MTVNPNPTPGGRPPGDMDNRLSEDNSQNPNQKHLTMMQNTIEHIRSLIDQLQEQLDDLHCGKAFESERGDHQ
jgi:hypothetical protein